MNFNDEFVYIISNDLKRLLFNPLKDYSSLVDDNTTHTAHIYQSYTECEGWCEGWKRKTAVKVNQTCKRLPGQ